MKLRNIIYTFLIITILSLFIFNNKVSAVSIPDEVLQKAKELNYNYDNIVILRDKNTKELYIPYMSNDRYSSSLENGNWKFTIHNNVECLITPSWWLTGLKLYKNNELVEVSTNNVGSNSIIQLQMDSRVLEVVYSSKNILYFNVEGLENDSIFFPITPSYQIQEMTEITQLPKIITEVLKVIIPIGLAILSVVLLISLIKSVISRVV